MSGGTLLLLMLLVSLTSLILQTVALANQLLERSRSETENIVRRGFVRTAGCRMLTASVYFSAALLQTIGVPIPGSGGLTPEALVIFTGAQLVWWYNAAMDLHARRKLAEKNNEK